MLSLLAGCATVSNEPAVKETVPQPTYAAEENRMASPIAAAKDFAGGSGTQEDPYQIETAEQLALLAKYVNEEDENFSKACYIQTEDIVMNDTSNLENWDKQAPEWSWIPIGLQDKGEFQGYYDGAGHSISGMYIYYVHDAAEINASDCVGLFGRVYEGTVKNVTLQDSYVYAAGANAVGGIVGDASYSEVIGCTNGAGIMTLDTYGMGGVCGAGGNETTFDGCHNVGTVYGEGSTETGGICGSARVSIINSTNTGDITANGYVGGICGRAPALIENCQNSGAIVNVKDKGMLSAGGIAAISTKDIRNCHNSGTVSGDTYVGGIVGDFSNMPHWEQKTGFATLTLCTNEGMITGSHTVGGIIGITTIYNGDLTVSDCTNNGTVSGNGDNGGVSGITGAMHGGSDGNGLLLENCKNFGDVSHGYAAGGICGDCSIDGAPMTIQNCSNMGKIAATNSSGGILGQINPGEEPQIIQNSENSGEIVSENDGGGVVGLFNNFSLEVDKPEDILISQCTNSGTVFGKRIGGIVGAGSGSFATLQIEDSLNTGRVCGTDATAIGGILGIDIYTRMAGGKRPVFYIVRCVNAGPVIYGEGTLPFDTNLTYRKSHLTDDEILGLHFGAKMMGGIAGGVFQSVIEDCVNYGEITAQTGTRFVLTLEDSASYDTGSEEELMLAGAICGMYYFHDDVHTAENMGIRNCTYADSACAGYSEFALSEGAHTITGVHAVSGNQARELANELTKWRG